MCVGALSTVLALSSMLSFQMRLALSPPSTIEAQNFAATVKRAFAACMVKGCQCGGEAVARGPKESAQEASPVLCAPPQIFCLHSPYQRTIQTSDKLRKAFRDDQILGVQEEVQLREQDFGGSFQASCPHRRRRRSGALPSALGIEYTGD